MDKDITYQVFMFILCCGFGVFVGMVFDVFRVSRRIICTGTVWTFVEDIIFWFIISIMFFVVILKFYDGEFRWFMMIGIFMGALIYLNTVSRFFVRISVVLVEVLVKITVKTVLLLFWPLKVVLRFLNKPVFVALNFGKRGIKRVCGKLVFDLNVFKKFTLKTKNIAKK